MRVLTYHKNFKQQVHCYCFDMINELEKRIKEDTEELEFFKKLQKQQKRCMGCHGEGKIRVYYDQSESTLMECKACNGTGEGSNDGLG